MTRPWSVTVDTEEITTVHSGQMIKPEKVLEICIHPKEKAEIEALVNTSHGVTTIAICNNQRKKEMWKYQRNLKRKAKQNRSK